LHDLQHAFAVRALQGSPADRSRTGAHMTTLATYSRHVNIYATYWYLEAAADLMRDVAATNEEFFAEGRQSSRRLLPSSKRSSTRRSHLSGRQPACT
jgi:integrase/recombinase XerD